MHSNTIHFRSYSTSVLFLVSIHHHAPYTFRVIDIQDDDGNTPLYWAVRCGQIQVVRLLLEHGTDVNLRDESTTRARPQHAQQRDCTIAIGVC
jgi:ankyrin repeat protein